MADQGPLQQLPPPQSSPRIILSNPAKYLVYGLEWTVLLAIFWCLSFILYPIQLAFGIRAYRNPRYDLNGLPKYLLITMLVLSTLEMTLLGTQLLWAYRAGSVEGLHLNVFKCWQYSKNLLVLFVFVMEILGLKFYIRYLDSWIERVKEKSPEDEAEKGLLEKDVVDDKKSDESKPMDDMSEKEATVVVNERELEDNLSNVSGEMATIVRNEKLH